MHVPSYCSKFAVKVDISPGGCQKLPNWVKITDQNADMLQSRYQKNILQQILKKKQFNLFYSIMQV